MPLPMALLHQEASIKKIGGQSEVKKFLEKLGFVPGAKVTVLSHYGGNVIVRIKDSSVAVSREMAMKIIV